MSMQNKSIQRLNKNISVLAKDLQNLRIAGTDAYAKELEAAIGYIAAKDRHARTLGSDPQAAVKAVAESLRSCARQGKKPPCDELTTETVKSLAPSSVPAKAVSKEQWHEVMNKWCDDHYAQSTEDIVHSVWWVSSSNQLGVMVNNPTAEQRAEIEKSLQRLKVGGSCCLYPWPPEGIEYSIIDVA